MINLLPHPFEPAKHANPNGPGLADAPECGYHQRIDEETGMFCLRMAEDPIHAAAWIECIDRRGGAL